MSYVTNRQGASDSFAVADGVHIRFYEEEGDWHYRIPIANLPPGWLEQFGASAPGPFRRLMRTDIDTYIARRNANQPLESYMRPRTYRAGTDTVFGHVVELKESTPSWANGEAQTSGGVTREWVESTHLLVIQSTSAGNDGSETSRAAVTRLEFQVMVDKAVLEFKPPRAAATLARGRRTLRRACLTMSGSARSAGDSTTCDSAHRVVTSHRGRATVRV